MAISIAWGTKVITVPKADTQLVTSSPTEIRDLDLDWFRLQLKDLEDGVDGMPHLDTHQHNTTVTVGGVTLARVIEIINGYTVTFEDGAYAVNLVGANSNIGDVLNFNQVQVRSANSAGLTFSEEINAQSFTNNEVYIDTVSGLTGVQFPRGTPTDPVDNFDDADSIANSRGFIRFNLRGTLSLGSGDILTDHAVIGVSPVTSFLTLSSTPCGNARFDNLCLQNCTMDGKVYARNCDIDNVTDWEGVIEECGVRDDITIKSSTTTAFALIDSTSRVPGTGQFTLDVNGANTDINIRNYTGGINLTNWTAGNTGTIDIHNGSLTVDASCTSGTLLVRGQVKLTDNSGGGFTVISDGIITETDPVEVADTVWDTSVPASPTSGTFGEKLKAIMSVTDWLGLRD